MTWIRLELQAFIDYGNGVTTTYSYNPLNRRLASLQSAPAGGSDFQNISYTYDNVGNITAIANNVAVEQNGQNGGPTSQQFSYDDLDRLTGASGVYDFAPGKQNKYSLSLSYDSVNNLGFIPQYSSTTFPTSSFFEVKAVAGVLSLSYSNSQIRGLIDVASRSAASGDTGPDRVLPTITFITTGNTVIGPDVLAEATRRGVAIWQAIAYEVPGPGGSQIGFTPAIPLNPQVFPTRGLFGQMFDPYIPVPPVGGASRGTLGPASRGGPPLQPDPVEVQ